MKIVSEKDLESPNLKIRDYISVSGAVIVRASWYSEDKKTVEAVEVKWTDHSNSGYVNEYVSFERVYFDGPKAFTKECHEVISHYSKVYEPTN